MRTQTSVIAACALLLGGCDLVDSVLPRHGTTTADARAAMLRCGIAPDSIAWSVSSDGTFAFGRKSAEASPTPETQDECLMRWVQTNRVKLAIIGWETGPR